MSNSRRSSVQAAGLLLAGAVAGGVLAASVAASADSAAPAATGGSGGPPPVAAYAATGPDGQRGPRPPLQAGTVAAVGTASVGIKTAAGTKTYAVDADSDIDKNGEAKLSDLKVGDAVHFAVRPGTSTIAVLHAGDEARKGPGGGRHHDGPCPGGMGPGGRMGPGPGTASPSATPSSNA
jgi:hypothetical protein